jgi:methyltransferase-like protein/cyclopropane fatty-acyl-phospholipid synthase-like methyltransferase
MTKQTKISYDDVPYAPLTFAYAYPGHFKTIGTLFGLTPPPLETARILELGCGGATSMLNFAEIYPKSYSLGIDLSEAHIKHGLETIKHLNLKNIDLKAISIMDIDESYGKFDYIICHGVFSWVPIEVREKILEVCNKLLNPNGIAFVSYNTLPGWNMQSTIREMMLFHSANFDDPVDKLQQAKLLLNFVNDALGNSNAAYSRFLQEETKAVFSHHDSYVLHEYLGEVNTGFYFHQFIEVAKKYNLNYLGDTFIARMFLGNLHPKAVEKLQEINDIVRTEQYMDFINNRKFRTTLLCHNNVAINRNIEFNKIKDFYTTFNIRPVIAEDKVDLTDEQENIGFYYQNLSEPFISTTSPVMKAILYVYCENLGNPINFEQIAKSALKKLNKYKLQDFLTALGSNFIKFIFQGYVQIFAEKPHSITNITTKPEVSSLARYQAQHEDFVTNRINDMIPLHPHEKHIVPLLDGSHTIDEIKQQILNRFISKELTLFDDQKQAITDEKLLKEFTDQAVSITLEKFRYNYILID